MILLSRSGEHLGHLGNTPLAATATPTCRGKAFVAELLLLDCEGDLLGSATAAAAAAGHQHGVDIWVTEPVLVWPVCNHSDPTSTATAAAVAVFVSQTGDRSDRFSRSDRPSSSASVTLERPEA